MSILHLLSYGAIVALFAFITLALASALLYLSELIEEHSRISKYIGQRGIYAIIVLHVVLYFSESLPLMQTLFSILCHFVYLQNFSSSWPVISLTSFSFVASCILVISDHFMWFFYFSRITQDARHVSHSRTYRSPSNSHTTSGLGFQDIATFFATCVWLAPLFLFLSLSANDNALPMSASSDSHPGTPEGTHFNVSRPRASLFKTIVDLFPRVGRKRRDEGIIAPRSPVPRSPILGPHEGSRAPSPMYLGTPGSPGGYGTPRESFDRKNNFLSPTFQLTPPPKRSFEGTRRATLGDLPSLRPNSRRVTSSPLHND